MSLDVKCDSDEKRFGGRRHQAYLLPNNFVLQLTIFFHLTPSQRENIQVSIGLDEKHRITLLISPAPLQSKHQLGKKIGIRRSFQFPETLITFLTSLE